MDRIDGSGGALMPCSKATERPKRRPPWKGPPKPLAPADHAAQPPRCALDIPIPAAPYLDRSVREVPHLAEVWSYINPFMLYGRHLGYKGNFEKELAAREDKALELFHNMEEVKQEAARFMKVKAVWQFFEAERDGNDIHLFSPGGASPIHTFRFGRQRREDGLCLSDYILGPEEGRRDHLALFVVTAGACIRERSEELKQAGEFFKAHAIQALGTRNGRRRGRVATPPHPRGLGLPRLAYPHHARSLHLEVSRQALQLRLSRLPQPGRSKGPVELAAPRKTSASTSPKA